MKELKTLKDFEIKGEPEDIEKTIKILNVVKAEAVKWVKTRECDYHKLGERCYICENLDKWIKHFFNLTEEDLKEVGK